MTISELKRELQKLEEAGHGDTEIRTQVDMSDGYMEYGTAPICCVVSWVVVETPTEFEGVMYYDDEAAQKEIDAHYTDTPLNQRDDEELKTKTFFLIERGI